MPDLFLYAIGNETKPDFSLTGVWVAIDTDANYSTTINNMTGKDNTYGFIANTKSMQITSNDINAIANVVGVGVPDDPISDITNTNRVILKVINQKLHEPIKANVTHNTVNKRLEIRVTYTSNGIKEILDENGNSMTLSIVDGITYTDTGNTGLASGTHSFTVIDNKNNEKKLSINITVDSLLKANVTHNTEEQRLEVRVTYTSNGIKEILDENGNSMTLTEQDGTIYTDTGNAGLASGTYSFTVIDNQNNEKKLSINITVDSLFKVAYINGTDNMTLETAYSKSQETKTSTETTLVNQIKAKDTSTTYVRAITDTNSAITAIGTQTRTSEDEQMYLYEKYDASSTITYLWQDGSQVGSDVKYNGNYGYRAYSTDANTGQVTFSNAINVGYPLTKYNNAGHPTLYYSSRSLPVYSQASQLDGTSVSNSSYYRYEYKETITSSASFANYHVFDVYEVTRITKTTYSKGNLVKTGIIAKDGTYTVGSSTAVHKDGYWYVRGSKLPKYTLYKYDQDLVLKSKYDVETKTITTVPIDISNKGNNKVKLTLSTSGTNYKLYISNDNSTWQQVTGISSGTAKELNVDGWNNLYIKIETNTSRINSINVAYYKN